MMDPNNDPEKAGHLEGTETNSLQSEIERTEAKAEAAPSNGYSAPDDIISHDLERQITASSKKSGVHSITLHRTNTKLSRIATNLTSRSKKEKERLAKEIIPLSDLDNGIVGWESQDDPAMPRNFPEKRKWVLILLVSAITFLCPLASSIFAPAVGFMDAEFHNTSTILSSLVVSIFVLGFAVGPLILSPLCEIYGRRPVLTCANIFFCLWHIGCARAPNLNSLIVFRFLAGVGGSGCQTIGGGVIADLFQADRRGIATVVYSLGPLVGPVSGPVMGGFIAQRAGWRWVFWIVFIAGTVVTVGIEVLNSETNPTVLMDHKVRRLRIELNRPELRSCYATKDESPKDILIRGFLRPWRMLFTSPIIFLLCLYMALVYGLLYLLFTTITSVMIETYHWQPDITGLAYLGVGAGFFPALALTAKLSDATIIRMTKANNGVTEPEMRLPACIFFACFVPISFFWYGWCADKGAPWPSTVIGLAPFGFGMIGIFIPIQTYIIDAFPQYAASGLAALVVARSLFGTFLPLAGPYMYKSLGLGWGNSALGFIALGLIPAPYLIFKYGKTIRTKYPINL